MNDPPHWQRYNPNWLLFDASSYFPQRPWLKNAIRNCNAALWESHAYVYFVDPSNANKTGSPWQFDHNLQIERTRYGNLVLDILKDRQIGGIEFLERLDDNPL